LFSQSFVAFKSLVEPEMKIKSIAMLAAIFAMSAGSASAELYDCNVDLQLDAQHSLTGMIETDCNNCVFDFSNLNRLSAFGMANLTYNTPDGGEIVNVAAVVPAPSVTIPPGLPSGFDGAFEVTPSGIFAPQTVTLLLAFDQFQTGVYSALDPNQVSITFGLLPPVPGTFLFSSHLRFPSPQHGR
jgi:hypothetical protein